MRLLLVALALLVGPACEWVLPEVAPRFRDGVPLVPPWDATGLPVEGGEVTHADEETLSVRHAKGDALVLGRAYAQALDAAGWSRAAETSAGGMVNEVWTDPQGRRVALAAMDEGERVVVSLSVLP